MVTVDKAIIARLTKDGKHFEILVDSELAYDLKENKSVSIQKMLAVNQVYTDSKKGDRCSDKDLIIAFGTSDIEKVANDIVRKGEVQLTTEFKRKKTEEKRKQIADFISKNAINPQTKTPHPIDRILASMDQSRINIDPFKSTEEQIDDVIKVIKIIIPISMEQTKLNILIPASYSSLVYGKLKEFTIEKTNWLNDGSLNAVIIIPSGLKENVYKKLGNMTAGTATIEEVK